MGLGTVPWSHSDQGFDFRSISTFKNRYNRAARLVERFARVRWRTFLVSLTKRVDMRGESSNRIFTHSLRRYPSYFLQLIAKRCYESRREIFGNAIVSNQLIWLASIGISRIQSFWNRVFNVFRSQTDLSGQKSVKFSNFTKNRPKALECVEVPRKFAEVRRTQRWRCRVVKQNILKTCKNKVSLEYIHF